jgi:hypothetical protein
MAIEDSFDVDTLREIAGPDTRPLNERIMAFAGNPDAQFMQIPDASAGEDDAAGADQQGNQGEDGDTEGLDTQSDEDGQDADSGEGDDEETDETNGQEAETAEEKQKGTKKKTLEERAAEIAERIVNQKLAERDKASSTEQPDFVEIDRAKVDAYIDEMETKIDELRLEGKYAEARKLSRQLDQLDADLEANEQRKQAYIERQKSKRTETDTVAQVRQELDDAAELYRHEMKIDPKVWDAQGKWFEQQINSKPLLVAEFQDVFQRKGKVAAIRFAHEYVVANMGQTTKRANEQKEKQKTKTAAITATTTGKAAPLDLKKIREEFNANPTDENFQRLQAAKRQMRAA